MAKGLNRKERKNESNVPKQPTIPLTPILPKKHLEKKVRRYVIVDVDNGTYLYKKPGEIRYVFVESIISATKTQKRNEAYFVMQCYRADTGDPVELTVIPVDITYELIEETNNDYDYEKDIAEEINKWTFLN